MPSWDMETCSVRWQKDEGICCDTDCQGIVHLFKADKWISERTRQQTSGTDGKGYRLKAVDGIPNIFSPNPTVLRL